MTRGCTFLYGFLLITTPVILAACHNRPHDQTPTKATLTVLHEQVMMFKLDTGRFPTEQEGLQALVKQPPDVKNWDPSGYLLSTRVPKDAWGNDFVYNLTPESDKPFIIMSYGADGKKGGEGINADLYSVGFYDNRK